MYLRQHNSKTDPDFVLCINWYLGLYKLCVQQKIITKQQYETDASKKLFLLTVLIGINNSDLQGRHKRSPKLLGGCTHCTTLN